MPGMLFEEDGVTVDDNLIRVGTQTVSLHQVRRVADNITQPGSKMQVMRAIWGAFATLCWVVKPNINFAFYAMVIMCGWFLYRHFSPLPKRHHVVVNIGTVIPQMILVTTDEDQAHRLIAAIEQGLSQQAGREPALAGT